MLLDTVRPGIAVMLERRPVLPERLALLCNASSLTPDWEPVQVALLKAGYDVVRLLAPEHGLQGALAAGAEVARGRDLFTGLPVEPAYGPGCDFDRALEGVCGLLVDLQDIGARYYTYVATALRVIDACWQRDIPVWILDRPNPLGGRVRTGPVWIRADHRSLVAAMEVPIRHGLTMGELVRLQVARRGDQVPLQVIPCSGWDRRHRWHATGLPWVPPSPAATDEIMMALYPGTCLLEGLNVSFGRGTALPFRVVGAPWMEAPVLWRRLKESVPAGVRVRPHSFVPACHPYRDQLCRGVALDVESGAEFDAVALGLEIIAAVRQLFPDRVRWRKADGRPWIDRLLGRPDERLLLEQGLSVERIAEGWRREVEQFEAELATADCLLPEYGEEWR